MKQSKDIVNVIRQQVRDLARDPGRRRDSVVAAEFPGGKAYFAGLEPGDVRRTLVCCVFSDPREALAARLARGRSPLSPTQMQVAFMLARRLSNREIAERLGSSPCTVRRHTEAVLQRLRVRRRTEVEPALRRLLTRTLHESVERFD